MKTKSFFNETYKSLYSIQNNYFAERWPVPLASQWRCE